MPWGSRGSRSTIDPTAAAVRVPERLGASLWPTVAPWASTFDDLALEARERGAEVLLDGQGGDDLLDAGFAAGTLFRRRPVALLRWLQAERRYTGAIRPSLAALRDRPRPPERAPDWLAPELRDDVERRFAAAPVGYAAVRDADVVDAVLSAQREETFDHGLRTGLFQRHPLWDAELVALLDGLDPAALVAGGHPKSPARRYLRHHVPAVRGAWPRPKTADIVARQILANLRSAHPRLEFLAELGVVRDPAISPTQGVYWRILSLQDWLSAAAGQNKGSA